MSIPHAAAIIDTLADAGMTTPGAIRTWFQTPRRELGGLTPNAALSLGARLDDQPAGQTVPQLARADVAPGGYWAGEAA